MGLARHISSLVGRASAAAYEDGNAIAMDDVGVEPMSLALRPCSNRRCQCTHPLRDLIVDSWNNRRDRRRLRRAYWRHGGGRGDRDEGRPGAPARCSARKRARAGRSGSPARSSALAGRPAQDPTAAAASTGGSTCSEVPRSNIADGNRSRHSAIRSTTIDERPIEYLLSVAGEQWFLRREHRRVSRPGGRGRAWLPCSTTRWPDRCVRRLDRRGRLAASRRHDRGN